MTYFYGRGSPTAEAPDTSVIFWHLKICVFFQNESSNYFKSHLFVFVLQTLFVKVFAISVVAFLRNDPLNCFRSSLCFAKIIRLHIYMRDLTCVFTRVFRQVPNP